MFISPEKSQLHWFNAASIDTDSEFHLIGMVSYVLQHVVSSKEGGKFACIKLVMKKLTIFLEALNCTLYTKHNNMVNMKLFPVDKGFL